MNTGDDHYIWIRNNMFPTVVSLKKKTIFNSNVSVTCRATYGIESKTIIASDHSCHFWQTLPVSEKTEVKTFQNCKKDKIDCCQNDPATDGLIGCFFFYYIIGDDLEKVTYCKPRFQWKK